MEKKYEFFVRFSNESGFIRESIIECEHWHMTEDENNVNFISLDSEQWFSYNKKFIVSYGKRTVTEPKELDIPF